MTPIFVAEVSSNHNRDLQRCFEFIDTAAAIGCDAVKFQLFKIEELFAPEILAKSAAHRKRKEWELPVEFVPLLSDRCRKKNIQFSCTPFYIDAVTELLPYIDFYKIASYELLWNDLLVACAQTGKPLVLSTGMAKLKEVKGAVEAIITAGCKDLTLLHCVSGYPTPVGECNLAAIQTMRRKFAGPASLHRDPQKAHVIKIGWSDHSVCPGVLYRAIHRWGAEMIEFHLDLDGTGEEFKTGHCWLPEQIKTVIEAVRTGFAADGTGIKKPAQSEISDCDWRADPSDGLRPLLKIRKNWSQ